MQSCSRKNSPSLRGTFCPSSNWIKRPSSNLGKRTGRAILKKSLSSPLFWSTLRFHAKTHLLSRNCYLRWTKLQQPWFMPTQSTRTVSSSRKTPTLIWLQWRICWRGQWSITNSAFLSKTWTFTWHPVIQIVKSRHCGQAVAVKHLSKLMMAIMTYGEFSKLKICWLVCLCCRTLLSTAQTPRLL